MKIIKNPGLPEENYRRIVETTEEGIWINDPNGKVAFVNQKMAVMLGFSREEMIGKTVLDFVDLGQPESLKSRNLLREGTSILREFKLRRKDGGAIWTHVNASPLFDEKGNYIGNLLMHTDITERKQLEQALDRAKEDLEMKVESRTRDLRNANLKLQQGEQQMNDLFEVMAQGVIYLSAERVIKLNPEAMRILGLVGISLENYQYTGNDWPLWSPQFSTLRPDGTLMPPEERVVARVFKEKRALKNQEMGLKRPDGSVVWLDSSAVPLINKDRKLTGVVNTFMDISESKILRDERSQFTKRLMQVQEDERKRISRELHDDTAQYLSLLTLELDSIVTKERQLHPETITHLQKLQGTARKALEEVRRFSHELRPTVLEDFGLAAALELITGELNALGSISVDFNVTGSEQRLPNDIELALFRIAQEALSNVRKHSQAKSVEVVLHYTPKKVRLSVADNGVGFRIAQKRMADSTCGLGLVGMRERAQLIGATLRIKSRIGSGTTIAVEVLCGQ